MAKRVSSHEKWKKPCSEDGMEIEERQSTNDSEKSSYKTHTQKKIETS